MLVMLFVSAFAQGFSDSDTARITTKAQDWTFNLKATMGEFTSRNALEQATHECVQTPSDVCVILDPSHRWTSVHFGNATGVPVAQFNVISAAGNSFFRTKDWAGGVIAIGERTAFSVKQAQTAAEAALTAPTPVATQTVVKAPSEGLSTFWIVLLTLTLAVGLIWLFVVLYRRQLKLDSDMDSFREERNEFLDANVNRILEDKPKPQPIARVSAPVYRPAPIPQPTTRVIHEHHNHSSNDGFITGMLVGQSMNPPAPRVVERVIERAPEPVRRSEPEPERKSSSWFSDSSSDSGGGGSSWGGGDSGGSDSGGGGSDW